MYRLLLLVAVMAFISSCRTPEAMIERACERKPELCERSDTLETILTRFDTVTIKTDSFRIDSIFVLNSIDSFLIDTGSVQLKIIRRVDSFFTEIIKAPDTIVRVDTFKQVEKVINNTISRRSKSWLPWILFAVALFFVVILARIVVKSS